MTRLKMFRPYREGINPKNMQPVTTFNDVGTDEKPDTYFRLFEDKGDVLVFSVSRVGPSDWDVRAAKFTVGGMCILDGDMAHLLLECDKRVGK